MKIAIRPLLAALVVSALVAACATTAPVSSDATSRVPQGPAQAPRTIRFLLNSGFSGANAWFLLAEDRGYFQKEGLKVEFSPGRGAFTAAGRIAPEGFDVGYGDIHAVIEEAAKHPDSAPTGVYMMFDRAPSAIILPADSPINTPQQLQGKTVTGHATDVALNTFAQFGERTGIDIRKVKIVPNDSGWKELLGLMNEGKTDALFGYLTTTEAAVNAAGQKPGDVLKFIPFRDVLPEAYGSAIMVSGPLLRESPDTVAALVRAINHGVADTVCDPDAAIAALVKRDPKQDPRVEKIRLLSTMEGDMGGAHRLKQGFGDIDNSRMQASIVLTTQARGLPLQPSLDKVFRRDFLPPISERQSCASTPVR